MIRPRQWHKRHKRR